MGPSKPSRLVTTLSNRPSLHQGGLLQGEYAAHDDDRVGRSLGANTSSWEQGPNFDLVGTSRTVVIHETQEAMRTTYWLGSFPAGCTPIRITATPSYMSDRLVLLSSRTMSCCIDGMD
jgi:hypothetical protein